MNNISRILAEVRALKQTQKRVIIAIDGRCGSGKTSLAESLRQCTNCEVIHMDDFFLRPEQINDERLSMPGENIDWERLEVEVLQPLLRGETCHYHPYDCHTRSYKPTISCHPSSFIILEGAYSCNSHLWDYSDLHIFLTISPEEQLRRIIKRNGKEWADVFKKKWIPLEELYINTQHIESRCELHLSGETV